jgi:iron-sulfur cluster assembly protein
MSELGCSVSIYNVSKPDKVVICDITLTESAGLILKNLIETSEEFKDSGFAYLYIDVVGGGCSGYLYDVNIKDDYPSDDKQIIISQDINIVINNSDSTLLNEIIIDWNDSLMGGGLKFINPNATKTCSCGISFGG